MASPLSTYLQEKYVVLYFLRFTYLINDFFFKTNGGLIELYEQFLSDFEHRINPLSLVELILVIAEELTDHEKALALFKKTEEKIKGNYMVY